METKEVWVIMSMLYSEDVYGLGLLYAYIYAGKKMVLKEDLDKFHEIIEFNLRNMNYNEITPIWYDEEPKRLPKKLNDTCIDGYVDIYVNSSVINSNPKFIELFYTDIDCMLYILKSKQMIKKKYTNKSIFYN